MRARAGQAVVLGIVVAGLLGILGALVVTAQALGTLAVYLLEPESEDGLAAWGLFDGGIEAGVEFPVYRLRAASDAEPTKPPTVPPTPSS